MKVIILAAGVGSRLLPYTNTLPKCLLKIGGYSILDYQISALKKCGIQDIVMVIGHYGDKIRELLKIPVNFIENKDYATTNSSYSLWLARDFIKDGFIYINSDLLFHPKMLKVLLDAPEPDAIIIDRKINPSSDMYKAHMAKNRILRMDKKLDHNLASAEVIGPAKFSSEGASQIIQRLEHLVSRGEKNNWCYQVFSDVAKTHPLIGVENPGYPWAEIDTPEDLSRARSKIAPLVK